MRRCMVHVLVHTVARRYVSIVVTNCHFCTQISAGATVRAMKYAYIYVNLTVYTVK
jgi:hypothetical protein